jgi:hypothetical protein
MIDRREKLQIIVDLFENNSCSFSKNTIMLLNVLIEEARVSNDDAEGPEVVRNQGKIIALKSVRDYILKGIPPRDETQKGINLT